MSLPRLLFMGADPIALPFLDFLWNDAWARVALVGCFTQPDRASGRGKKVRPGPIKTWFEERGLPALQPEKPRQEAVDWVREEGIDISLVMAYGHILTKALLDAPRHGTVNLHASLLPQYRGASPIETAVAQGDPATGVSLMRLVPKMDAGPVADREEVPIGNLDTADLIRERIAQACVPLLARNLDRLMRGELVFAPQDESQATYCRRLVKDDGALDFNLPARVLADRIRGLFPWPGCFFDCAGDRYKVGLATMALDEPPDPALDPGRCRVLHKKRLLIATGEGFLEILRIQKPGGKMLPTPDFLQGHSLEGCLAESRFMPPLTGREPFPYRVAG